MKRILLTIILTIVFYGLLLGIAYLFHYKSPLDSANTGAILGLLGIQYYDKLGFLEDNK